MTIAAGKTAAGTVAGASGLVASSKDKTRGGAAKRVFKPTIPSLQPIRKTRSQSQSLGDKDEGAVRKRGSTSPRGKAAANNRQQKRSREPIQKNYVQLESNVFTGISASQQQSAVKRTSGASSSSSAKTNTINVESKVKKEDGKPLKNLMRDDFITDTSEDEDSDGEQKYSSMKPIGWDSLFFEEKEDKKSDSPPEPAATADVSPASVLQDGRMFLIQLPEQMIPLTDDQLITSAGAIGRMRIYASGRVEFVDETMEESVETFTCLRSDDAVTTIAIKDENGTETLIDIRTDAPSSGTRKQEHVVLYDSEEREAVSCGTLNPLDKLVLIPDMQPDVR